MIIRQAEMPDAVAICRIVNYHAERGRMLHRSLEQVYEQLRNFLVAQENDEVVGCVAVEIAWADLAEVKSLAVDPECIGRGIGKKLVQAAIEDARRFKIGRLFALTYEKDFFVRCGFHVIDRDCLPSKVWSDCITCPRRTRCDEIAVMLLLDAPPPAAEG